MGRRTQALAVLAVLAVAGAISFALFAPPPGVSGDFPAVGTPDAAGDRPGVVDANDTVTPTTNVTVTPTANGTAVTNVSPVTTSPPLNGTNTTNATG